MSKYQKLTNNDATVTLTDDENFALFCKHYNDDDDGDHHRQEIQKNQSNSHHQHQHRNHHLPYNNDQHDDVDDNHVEDLIQYNDRVDNKCNSNNSTTGNVNYMNGGSYTSGRLGRNARGGDCNGSSNHLLITASDADDSTMEIPLLQHGNYNNNNNNSNHKGDFEYGCLCQQKGFASNLSNNSTQTAKSKILWAIGMCCIFMIVEFLGGYIAGSLAIMTDAAHLASDCISFVIGLVAICLGSRPPDAKMSFGYKRLEVMGALISILGIWILTATLVLVAIQRVYANDYDLNADTMMAISGIGILINVIMVFILHTSSSELPEGGIAAHGHSHGCGSHNHNHGHSHSHSHNHSHSHSHNHHGHSQRSQQHSPRSQRHRPVNDSSHLRLDNSARPFATDDNGDASDADVGHDIGHGPAVDTNEATSIELSPAPPLLNGGDLKHPLDGNDKNLNLRAAMIHVIGDLVQSSGVFIAAVLIKIYPKAVVLDPLCTLLFSVIVIMTTINLFRESIHILMDSVPQGISLPDLELDLLSIEGVKSIHHLNVWNHTSNHSILMAHIVIDFLADSNTVLMKATQLTNGQKYKIKHSTIQIERVNS